ncbi:MAG: hypothetical protein K6C36_00450 [Clostridia bacterium]|nr:hypothetical protein [Clostridia bacterium]
MKKTLAVLLAVLLSFSVAVFAFAEDAPELGEGWVAIPTSAEGLDVGAYYLDFSSVDYGEFLSTKTYLFNEEEVKLTSNGEDVTSYLAFALAQVGTEYVKVKLPGEAKSAGDYYLDMAESDWAAYSSYVKAIYKNKNESTLFEGKIITVYEGEETETVLPLMKKVMGDTTTYDTWIAMLNSVKIAGADDAGSDDAGTQDGGKTNVFADFWAKIVAFFNKIGEFFKNLFAKK